MEDPLTIVFEGIPPSKKNSKKIIFRRGSPMLTGSDNFHAWHEETLWLLKKVKRKFKKVSRILMVFYPTGMRKHDCTNVAESINDILVDAGIIVDDNWFDLPKVHLEFGGIVLENAKVEVTIYP